MSDFLKCPQAFYYKSILRLASLPTEATTRGTLAHSALEGLFSHPRDERTAEVALAKVEPAWTELLTSDDRYRTVVAVDGADAPLDPDSGQIDYTALEIDDAKVAALLDSARSMVTNYFAMERPQTFDPTGLELRLTAEVDGVSIHGIIDRLDELEVASESRVFVSDYKGLALDTPLPTPTGWTTMADVAVGDRLLGADGRPCQVVAKSQVHHRPCYELIFSDGSTIVCDNEHRWAVRHQPLVNAVPAGEERAAAVNATGGAVAGQVADEVLDADALFALLATAASTVTVTNTAPLELGLVAAPDPYAVGLDAAKRDSDEPASRASGEVDADLAALLRGTRHQRTALLRGLLDGSSASTSMGMQATFVSASRSLADAVAELACSLGESASVTAIPLPAAASITQADGGADGEGYEVSFTATRLAPDSLLVTRPDRPEREIVSMRPVPSVPTQCVAVDAPDSLYLAGLAMIPTHNTGKLPRPRYLDDAFFAMRIYAVLVEEALGKRVHSLRLIYLQAAQRSGIYTLAVDDRLLRTTRQRIKAISRAIETAYRRSQWPTRTGPLCNWCDFQPICPAFNPGASGLSVAGPDGTPVMAPVPVELRSRR